MDAAASLLFRLIAMGTRSLLQYVSESDVYTADKRHAALDAVRAVAGEEQGAVARLTRYLQKQRVRIPPAGSFPSHFTTTNFVSIDYLVPKLIAEHEKEIAEIEQRLHPIENEENRALAEGYLAMKRRHLDTLRSLASSPAAA